MDSVVTRLDSDLSIKLADEPDVTAGRANVHLELALDGLPAVRCSTCLASSKIDPECFKIDQQYDVPHGDGQRGQREERERLVWFLK